MPSTPTSLPATTADNTSTDEPVALLTPPEPARPVLVQKRLFGLSRRNLSTAPMHAPRDVAPVDEADSGVRTEPAPRPASKLSIASFFLSPRPAATPARQMPPPASTHLESGGRHCGLANLGNTCYVGAVVQALRACVGFTAALDTAYQALPRHVLRNPRTAVLAALHEVDGASALRRCRRACRHLRTWPWRRAATGRARCAPPR